MICFKEEIVITQDEEFKEQYLELYTKENGWRRTDTTTTITLKREQWLNLEPRYMRYETGEEE